MAADRLPPEIVAEIFSRVPVKSLLRFRSISKSLKSLIDSHSFTNLHLKNSLNRSLILRHKFDLYQLQIDDDDDFSKSIIPLNHPFKTVPITRTSFMPLIGSCNGLLAISNSQICFTHPYAPNEITVLNPNTHKHRIIPFLPLAIPNILESENIDRAGVCVHGFGYDPLTGDYKLLRISWIADLHYSFDPQVRLFSSKTNSWKIIPSMPYALQYVQAMGVFVQNSIHWVMTRTIVESHPCFIVAFNLTLETFNVVPFPAEIEGEEVTIAVAVLGECLCMTVNYETTKIDVWVMKQYGSRDSWCKLFTLVKSRFTLKSLRPLCYSRDGSKVLLDGTQVLLEVNHRKLFWYDLKSEQISYVEGIPNLDEAMICVESLLPPSFPVDNCRKKENHTNKRKKRYFLLII
ncbi:putative F-box domain, galactose oxidase/kelch, beta-propeller, F-box associated interaction [Medicago truncatula]|uniref:F-box protein interaction domain protein n=1 Tax=Medicago truncatula TaxID=3880 RepID=A0A072V4N6_MEDTR|nr:F-box protein interaction domain protein [Medicago truncatula]RHN72642.1 putative F-box domain, galactose oxidase/kelch, beta-propeller, F-box associated interaction [Medicago truncatula]